MKKNNIKGIASRIIPNSDKLRVLASLPEIKKWRLSHPEDYPTFKNRTELYDFVNKKAASTGITYLEFGVYKGDSIKYWTQINQEEKSRLYGFDTFTGLPEDWVSFSGNIKKNTFSTNGKPPEINDSRVTFIKGLFQDTLPNFLATCQNFENLIIHMDADIYTSTLYTLTKCDPIIKKGTIIMFDEFSSVLNEFRALNDYTQSYKRSYDVIGVTNPFFEQIAIQVTN